MPLIHSSSDKARSANIATEINAGKKPNQAAAIAYDIQRRSDGGSTTNNVQSPMLAKVQELSRKITGIVTQIDQSLKLAQQLAERKG